MNTPSQDTSNPASPAGSESAPAPAAVLRMRKVAVAHPRAPGEPLINDVDWTVHEGDFWVAAGMQGSGKTLLLETAAGLHPLTEGEIELFGQTVTGNEGDTFAASRRRLGLVFEGGGRLFQQLTVAENIALPLQYHRDLPLEEVLEEIIPLLEWTGLTRMAHVPAGRIGRAWAQRAALARALALRPELLFLDNPLAGMDVQHTRWWRRLIAELSAGHPMFNRRPLTLVVACDDLRPWLDLGRNYVLAHDRRWRILGTRAEVVASSEALVREMMESVF